METQTFTFRLQRRTKKSLKQGNQMISANDRLHYHVKGQLTHYLRQLPHAYKHFSTRYNAKHPCKVIIDIHPPTHRRMDAPNWYPTVKALIDGFVDMGLLSDDNNKIIKETLFRSTRLSGHSDYELQLTFQPVPLCPKEGEGEEC